MVNRSSRNISVAMYAVGYRDLVRSSAFVGCIVIFMYRLVVAVGEDSQRCVRLSSVESRLPRS